MFVGKFFVPRDENAGDGLEVSRFDRSGATISIRSLYLREHWHVGEATPLPTWQRESGARSTCHRPDRVVRA